MQTIKQRIIKEWTKQKLVHQSYSEIAKKVGCDKTYVFKVLKELKVGLIKQGE